MQCLQATALVSALHEIFLPKIVFILKGEKIKCTECYGFNFVVSIVCVTVSKMVQHCELSLSG